MMFLRRVISPGKGALGGRLQAGLLGARRSRVITTRCLQSLTTMNNSHPVQALQPKRYLSQSSALDINKNNADNIQNLMGNLSSPQDLKKLPVKILYASQGGTAQLFAMQLSEAIEEVPDAPEVTVMGLHEGSPADILEPGEALHVFLTSVAGVGEPPDNGRDFYFWLMEQSDSKLYQGLDFTVFGLGNQKAHPSHFNVISKSMDAKLEELGANRVFPLGLGDDGECIEDDFDNWLEDLVQKVYHSYDEKESEQVEEAEAAAIFTTVTSSQEEEEHHKTGLGDNMQLVDCVGAKGPEGKRLVSTKLPRLQLLPPKTDYIRQDLFHLSEDPNQTSFYQENVKSLPVLSNVPLDSNAGENGLYEMRVSLDSHNVQYETGDHLMVYPRNSHALVEGYLAALDVNPNSVIAPPQDQDNRHPYPHPTGITLAETLSHCVDLGALPAPAFARILLGRKDIDYKEEIFKPRRTVLELMTDTNAPRKFSLEEILFHMSPMRHRYYSIASSSVVRPNEIILTYRPVSYVTSRGALRLGTSTAYMTHLRGLATDSDGTQSGSELISVLNSNPTFRLPEDKKTPVLLIAGGCGIAPIRSFLEERIHYATAAGSQSSTDPNNPYGPGYLFLGFRTPTDAPYRNLIAKALQCGAISNVHITYQSVCASADDVAEAEACSIKETCGMVSDAVGDFQDALYPFFTEQGGHTYICGGARLFGVAIENKVHKILEEGGNKSEEEATKYLQQMLAEGRFHEDLSD